MDAPRRRRCLPFCCLFVCLKDFIDVPDCIDRVDVAARRPAAALLRWQRPRENGRRIESRGRWVVGAVGDNTMGRASSS